MQRALADLPPEMITRELIARTRYQVIADPETADALLSGGVVKIDRTPVVFDPVVTDPKTGVTTGTGRASVIKVSVVLHIALTEQRTRKVLYQQDRLEFRQQYELSSASAGSFDESGIALERLSREVARAVVARMLEQF